MDDHNDLRLAKSSVVARRTLSGNVCTRELKRKKQKGKREKVVICWLDFC